MTKGMREGWGWYGKARRALARTGYVETEARLQMVALAMAIERHGDAVTHIDDNGTERTAHGTHCSGRGQGYYNG